jgi:hypothetical protein
MFQMLTKCWDNILKVPGILKLFKTAHSIGFSTVFSCSRKTEKARGLFERIPFVFYLCQAGTCVPCRERAPTPPPAGPFLDVDNAWTSPSTLSLTPSLPPCFSLSQAPQWRPNPSSARSPPRATVWRLPKLRRDRRQDRLALLILLLQRIDPGRSKSPLAAPSSPTPLKGHGCRLEGGVNRRFKTFTRWA